MNRVTKITEAVSIDLGDFAVAREVEGVMAPYAGAIGCYGDGSHDARPIGNIVARLVGHLGHLSLLEMGDKLEAEKFSVGGRNGLTHLHHGHPVDAHAFPGDRRFVLPDKISSPATAVFCGPTARMAAIDANDGLGGMLAGGRVEVDIAFEKAMPTQFVPGGPKPKGGATEHYWIAHSRARTLYIFDGPRQPRCVEQVARCVDQERGANSIGREARCAVALTWRRSMHRVEIISYPARANAQNISIDELERVSRLRLYIDTDNVESRAVITHAGATSAAKQIKQTRTRHSLSLPRHDASGDHVSAVTHVKLLVAGFAALNARNRVSQVLKELGGLLLDSVVVEYDGHGSRRAMPTT